MAKKVPEVVSASAKELKQEKKVKRRRKGFAATDSSHKSYCLERGGHNYGVQPLGNLLLSCSVTNDRDIGLGNMRVLSDELVLDILSFLPATDLCKLAIASRAFYVFAHQDELWRTLTLNNLNGDFLFQDCWRQTFQSSVSQIRHSPLQMKGFYSDHLFQSWLCASLEIKSSWLERDNLPRRSDLSVDEFIRDFEEPNRPVIITDAITEMPAVRLWEREYLLKNMGEAKFAAGPVEISLHSYYTYADAAQEERPLYIFDPRFGEKAPQLADDYWVPPYFAEDLFSVLGDQRPDYRWLIMGPARSGSSWHIDPNATSAWNAVIRGSKKWILFPPDVVLPGVRPSPDGADVATSVSITEWLMNFYEEAKQGDVRPVEGICRAGEVLYVPHGWWHMVLNLEESVAITQNYVSRRNILKVLEFLGRPNAQALVSGTQNRESLHDLFKSKFDKVFPGTLAALKEAAEEKFKLKSKKAAFWDTASNSNSGGFRFNFEGADASEGSGFKLGFG